MLHFLSLKHDQVNRFIPDNIPSNNCISIFIPYKPGDVENTIDLARKDGTAKVLRYIPEMALRQEFSMPLLPAKAIDIFETDDEEEDEFSDEIDNKIGGHGIWLQNRIELPGKTFLLQVLGATVNENWRSHQGIFMGGVGYLFLNDEQNSVDSVAGDFKLQYT